MSAVQQFFYWSGVGGWALAVVAGCIIALVRHWNRQSSSYGSADQ